MLNAILPLLALLTGPVQAAPAQTPQQRRTIYNCSGYAGDREGAMNHGKAFFEDGTTYREYISWDGGGDALFPRADPAGAVTATLRWPGEHRLHDLSGALDWADGSIRITPLTAFPATAARKKREQWRRTLVDRNDAVHLYRDKGRPYVYVSSLDVTLASDLQPVSTSGLRMSLAGLQAWIAGARRATVYETLATLRRYRRSNFPGTAILTERVAAQYDIDGAVLAGRVARIRAEHERWLATLGDFHACSRGQEELDGDIVVT